LRKIDTNTGEIFTIKPGGMYAPLPIPAYQVLARLGDHQAQKVLMCLVSHLGSNGWGVFPSYSTIAYECGISRNGIKSALDVLEEFGFIKIGKWKEGKKDRNKYYLQLCCWDSGKMNKKALASRTPTNKCLDCGQLMDRGSYGTGVLGKIHYGCGGSVVGLKALDSVRAKRHPSA
jgi:hypothetical protein